MSKKLAIADQLAVGTAKLIGRGAVGAVKGVTSPILRQFERRPLSTAMAGGLGYYGVKGGRGAYREALGRIPGSTTQAYTPSIRAQHSTNPAQFYRQTGRSMNMRKSAMSEIRDRVKTSAPFSPNLRGGLMLGAGSVLGVAGATGLLHAGSSVYERLVGARRQAKAYEGMLEQNPSMEDTEATRRAFSTIHRFAPDVAADPIVSSTFVKRVVNYGDVVDPKQIKELVETQDKLRRTSSYEHPLVRSFSGGFDAGMAKAAQLEFARSARMKALEQERFEEMYG